ncbi:hypothetical protein AUJ46_04185 [Candidatus Peregrinibacteria bacterium CG1_02_54_53]|nr:MAG: hypothetical protein AUJ46_04185 [Candidatus Peregrinibacteria bacterium CG1_02_54_53]
MQLRFSTCIGIPVIAENTEEVVGVVGGILLHPDRSTIEGFFMRPAGFFSSPTFFLSSFDIVHFGHRILVRDHDRVGPVEDFLRVQSLLSDPRTVLDQRIRTESGLSMGRCRDVQFDTSTFRLTWIFPKRLLRWRDPISARDILEVRPEAIIVRDPPAMAQEKMLREEVKAPLVPLLPELPEKA